MSWVGSIRGWRAKHVPVDPRRRGRKRIPGRLRAHVITAMYSSVDDRAFGRITPDMGRVFPVYGQDLVAAVTGGTSLAEGVASPTACQLRLQVRPH
jgi:hypothetical protein